MRNQSAQVMAERFVEEAHWLGAGPGWILRRCLLQPCLLHSCLLHSCLLRRVIPSVPVPPTLNAADALVVLGLSFLGEGRRCCHTRQHRLKF